MASGEASTEPDATSALTPLIESLHRFAHPHHTLDLHKEKKRKNKMRLLNLMRSQVQYQAAQALDLHHHTDSQQGRRRGSYC